jgi:uncharacterized YigZ family protein
MRESYRTVASPSRIELEEKKSRFIASCRPLANEMEANAFVSGIRQEFPDATHHVYAWILSGETHLQRCSDDGEPQGTAGIPVLDVLSKNEISQAGVVVTRYFGGTLLGSGGLIHAYSKAAALALEASRPVLMQRCLLFRITVGYPDLDRLRYQLDHAGFAVTASEYGLDADLLVAAPSLISPLLSQLCADATAGAALIEPAGQIYRPLPPPDPPPA